MKPAAPPADKMAEDGALPEPGHSAWLRAKIERGLAQAENRESLIPAEQVWRDLGLAR